MKGSSVRGLVFGLAGCLLFSVTPAQLRKPTAEDLAMRGTGGAAQSSAAAVALPPSADPRDISGTWSFMDPARGPGGGMAAGGAGMSAGAPAGAAPAGAGPGGGETGGTRLQCFPSFTSFGGVEGVVDILQTERLIVFVGQEMQLVRRIYMNAEHPRNAQPSFFGDSVGRWDGDTLVVDTVGIKSGNTTRHVVERIRKINGGQNLEAVMVDPVTGATGRSSSVYWNPNRKLAEWICEDADEFWQEDYR